MTELHDVAFIICFPTLPQADRTLLLPPLLLPPLISLGFYPPYPAASLIPGFFLPLYLYHYNLFAMLDNVVHFLSQIMWLSTLDGDSVGSFVIFSPEAYAMPYMWR